MEQIIYIEQSDKQEAMKSAKSFTLENVYSRAYINSLAAELAMKYLALNNISVSNIYNMHKIRKIHEEFDLADIMLPNIQIDVRMVYDENVIFVPKLHFEYNLLPDIYLVFKMSEDAAHVEVLGFFEPNLINKNNQNRDFYFIEKEKLSNADNLKTYIENSNKNTTQTLSQEEMEDAHKLAMGFIDDNISEDDKRKLITLLTQSADLRRDLIEFDNFEWISYTVVNDADLPTPPSNSSNIDINLAQDPLNVEDEFSVFEDKTEEIIESETEEPNKPENTDISENDNTFEQDLTQENDEENIENIDIVEPNESEFLIEESEDEKDDSQIETHETTDMEQTENDILDNLSDEEIIDINEIPKQDENYSDEQTFIAPDFTNDIKNFANIEETVAENSVLSEMLPKEDDFETENEVPDNSEANDDFKIINENSFENSGIDELFDTEKKPFEELGNDETTDEPVVYVNSTTISNNDGNVGEIPIDINMFNQNTEEKINKFNEAYDEMLKADAKNVKKNSGLILTFAVIIAALAGVLTFVTINKMNAKNDNAISVLENNTADNLQPETSEQSVNESIAEETNISENLMSNPIIETTESNIDNGTETVSEPQKIQKIEVPYLEIKRVSWSIPKYVSANQNFASYINSMTKSIKTRLTTELLLVTENAYTNEFNINIILDKSGSLKNAKISKSSGSKQIDEIVLQTVKETLKVIKAPSGIIIGEDLHLILKLFI